MKFHYAAALAVLGLAVGSANAAFNVLDNFDSYAVGQDVLNNVVGGWTQSGSTPGSAIIVANPDGAGNVLQLANLAGANTSVYQTSPTITMPTGSTPATLFFMMCAKNDGMLHEGTAGMTDQLAPGTFSAGRGWTMFGNDGDGSATPASGMVGVGAYAQNATNDVSDPWGWNNGLLASDDVWYKIWQVYHVDGTGLTGGTFDIYIQGGTEFPTRTLFRSGYLRDTAGLGLAGPLSTMVMLSDDPSLSYFDNIYVDTGSADLADPTATGVPEPTTLGLLALGLVGLIARRRA